MKLENCPAQIRRRKDRRKKPDRDYPQSVSQTFLRGVGFEHDFLGPKETARRFVIPRM